MHSVAIGEQIGSGPVVLVLVVASVLVTGIVVDASVVPVVPVPVELVPVVAVSVEGPVDSVEELVPVLLSLIVPEPDIDVDAEVEVPAVVEVETVVLTVVLPVEAAVSLVPSSPLQATRRAAAMRGRDENRMGASL